MAWRTASVGRSLASCSNPVEEARAVTVAPARSRKGSGDFERRSERAALGLERDKLIRPERVEAVGVTGFINKLDLEGVVGKHLDHRADLAGDQAQFRHVADKRHGVEQVNL